MKFFLWSSVQPRYYGALVFGYDSVRIWSPNFSSVSDTSKYNNKTDTFELWSKAKAWYKQVQLSGPYIRAKLAGGDIDSLKSYPRPFSVQQDTTINRLNQITVILHADLKEGNLDQIFVFGNSKLSISPKMSKANQTDQSI
ncbi:MAG: hypothetical protein U5J63_03235 [Fodinibius sp.]|nr:hypothetical protein [Fodinibius sp.]